MNVLVISLMFPCKRHPTSAVFFANLMKELAPQVNDLTIVTPRVYIPKFLTRFKKGWDKWYLDPMTSTENGMEIIRPYFLAVPGISYEGLNGVSMHYSIRGLVKKLVQKKKVDIILGYNMLPDGIAAVRLAKELNLPTGFWAIGTDVNDYANYNRLNHYLSKKCIEMSDIIFTESLDLEKSVRNFTTREVKAETFYKGIAVSNFLDLPDRDELITQLNLDPGRKYLLFVGRLIYDKGIYELAEAFSQIADTYPDRDLILIGEERERDKLTDLLSRYNVLNRVIFKGIIPHEEIAHYMKVSEMLILPTWAEGLPNVLMEAMAAELPIVATDVGGIPEILKDGETGLSVPSKNVTKLVQAMLRMLSDVDLRKKCVHNAKKLIVQKFDVRKNSHILYDTLKGITTQVSDSAAATNRSL